MLGGGRVVEALGAWAAASGYTLSLESRFGSGLTPLHVAALLREPAEVAVALTGGQAGRQVGGGSQLSLLTCQLP